MGKVHSKHGSCFVVNAHFNPICQIDEAGSQRKKKASIEIVTNDQHLTCSEVSLSSLEAETKSSLKEESRSGTGHYFGDAAKVYPLQVALPPDADKSALRLKQENIIMDPDKIDEKREKADEEKSEKEQRLRFKEMTCDLSVENLQEFSFKLYNFDGHGKVTKDDISSLVRSIYGVVGKTVKFLPASGSKTIKVRVAISPEGESDDDDGGAKESSATQTPVKEMQESDCNVANASNSSVNSLNTVTTYLSTNNSDSPRFSVCHNHQTSCHAGLSSPGLVKGSPVSPSTRCKRGRHAASSHRQDHVQEWPSPDSAENQGEMKHLQCESTPEEHRARHKHRHQNAATNRDHLPESRERRIHYLGLAGLENHCMASGANADDFCGELHLPVSSPTVARETSYTCPCRVVERTHACNGKSRRRREAPEHHCNVGKNAHHRSRSHDVEQHPTSCYNNHVDYPRDYVVNVDFDVCNILPNDKSNWEHRYSRHRRSKSYDIYETYAADQGNFMPNCSPRTQQNRPSKSTPTAPLAPPVDAGHVPASPSRHQRHRHREKNQQRSMEQVANWLKYNHRSFVPVGKREHASLSHLASPATARKSTRPVVERHEHHHVHEHIHHHYHHYVDT